MLHYTFGIIKQGNIVQEFTFFIYQQACNGNLIFHPYLLNLCGIGNLKGDICCA